jgi:hypothetical protein
VLASTDAEGKATVQAGQAEPTGLRIEAAGFKPASVLAPGAEGEERTIALIREAGVAVSGTVTDAATGKPVPAFRVVCGTLLVTGPLATNGAFAPSPSSEDWLKLGGGKFRLAPGHFLDRNGDAKTGGFVLKFEADGYAPVLSRVIRADEGEVQLEVALVPAETVRVTVLNLNGRPALDAEIGLVRPGLGIQVTRERHLSVMRATGLLQADGQGAFSLPPDGSIGQVIAINPHGFAAATPAALAREPILRLQPFGGVEGRWLVGDHPAAGRELVLGMAGTDGGGYTLDCSTTTDSEGRFIIPQVPAGKYQLMWNAALGPGWKGLEGKSLTLSKPVADVEVRPGETSPVTFGGYVVTVRLRWPADYAPSKSTRVGVSMHRPVPEPPAAIIQDPQALAQWTMSSGVQAKLQAVLRADFVEGAGGSWTAEGVQAGASYLLEVMGQAEAATNGSLPVVYGRMPVTIPAEPSNGQFDAGELVLQGVNSAAAPAVVR